MPFTFTQLELAGLVLVEARAFGDERGVFMETYKASDFLAAGIREQFVQDNLSVSARGVVRGLHLQIGSSAQGKLVRVANGAVYDVAVDLRTGSTTYGRWVGIELTGENGRALYIPPGFAHGFQALVDDARLSYKCTAEYDRDAERGVRYDDRSLAIEWPLDRAIVSEKDLALPDLATFEREAG